MNNWEHDKLDRQESAKFLTSYLTKRFELVSEQNAPDTFVFNIRADWGFGKTFFIKHWIEDLEQAHYPAVYFDAWANDFSEDPLIGFIAEINTALIRRFGTTEAVKGQIDKAFSIGQKLIKPVGVGIATVLARKLANCSIEELKEIFSSDEEEGDEVDEVSESKTPEGELSSVIAKCAEVAIKEHLSKKDTIRIFKKRLERLVKTFAKTSETKIPLFIFIDELDRCRPTYAIELLEAIKHLFGVPGIYFVVSTNLEQLGHSIRAVYGHNFDSERYLKRFFDQEYLLPIPDHTRYTTYLFGHYSLNRLVNNSFSAVENGCYDETPPVQALFTAMADAFRLSLRCREQVCLALQAILLNWPEGERVHLPYLLFLTIVKQVSTKLFQDLSEKRFLNQKTFEDGLSQYLDPEATFKTHDLVSGQNPYQGTRISEHKISALVFQYHLLTSHKINEMQKRDWNTISFPEKIGNALCQDAPRSYSTAAVIYPVTQNYVARVSQAGQLA
jgi:hypothetical protein